MQNITQTTQSDGKHVHCSLNSTIQENDLKSSKVWYIVIHVSIIDPEKMACKRDCLA